MFSPILNLYPSQKNLGIDLVDHQSNHLLTGRVISAHQYHPHGYPSVRFINQVFKKCVVACLSTFTAPIYLSTYLPIKQSIYISYLS